MGELTEQQIAEDEHNQRHSWLLDEGRLKLAGLMAVQLVGATSGRPDPASVARRAFELADAVYAERERQLEAHREVAERIEQDG